LIFGNGDQNYVQLAKGIAQKDFSLYEFSTTFTDGQFNVLLSRERCSGVTSSTEILHPTGGLIKVFIKKCTSQVNEGDFNE